MASPWTVWKAAFLKSGGVSQTTPQPYSSLQQLQACMASFPVLCHSFENTCPFNRETSVLVLPTLDSLVQQFAEVHQLSKTPRLPGSPSPTSLPSLRRSVFKTSQVLCFGLSNSKHKAVPYSSHDSCFLPIALSLPPTTDATTYVKFPFFMSHS